MSSISEIATPTRRLSTSALILTSIYTLGVNGVWLSFNIFILPVQVQAVTSEATKGIVLGTLAGVAIGIAVIVNIIAGITSDHSNSRFGRRRPMLLWGMVLTLPFILLPIFLPLTLLTVSLSYLGMQIFTNVSSGAFQPTLADFIPVDQRGISAGFKGVFTLIGSAIGVGVITALFAVNLASGAYLLIAAVFALTTLINALAMRPYDKPLPDVKPLQLCVPNTVVVSSTWPLSRAMLDRLITHSMVLPRAQSSLLHEHWPGKSRLITFG